jgi:pimeloyl-ACP methyl ester carboxylesterase
MRLRVRALLADARLRVRRAAPGRTPRTTADDLAGGVPSAPTDGVPTPAELDADLVDVDWTTVPTGTRRDRVAAPSGELARIALGPVDGPRVVLVPGATGSKEDFLLLLPLLAAVGYRVEAYDMAGQYESAAAGPEHRTPPERHYALPLFADDLVAVLQDGPTPVHVLGYSFAGTVAASVTVEHPELVASLTLLSAPPVPGRAFSGLKLVGWLAGRASPRVAAAVMLWGIRWNVTRVVPARQAFVRARLPVTRRSSVVDIMAAMSRTPDLRAALREVPAPKLVATGTGDLWSVPRHQAFAATIGADFAGYATGHSPCETTPHQLAADLLRLYARAARPAP